MGWFSSNVEKTEVSENLGNKNINNVIIQEPVKLDHNGLLICVYILTIVSVIKLLMTLYKSHKKNIKKKYTSESKI